MKRRAYLAVAGGAAVGLAGCTELLADDEDYDVGMTITEFDPEEYEVTVGEEVVWHNTSSRGHTVTAYDGGIPDGAEYFASGGFENEEEAREAWGHGGNDGRIGVGEEFSWTFDVPGTYSYVCLPHEDVYMEGVVVVAE